MAGTAVLYGDLGKMQLGKRKIVPRASVARAMPFVGLVKILVLATLAVGLVVAAIFHQRAFRPQPMFVPPAPTAAPTEIPAPDLETP